MRCVASHGVHEVSEEEGRRNIQARLKVETILGINTWRGRHLDRIPSFTEAVDILVRRGLEAERETEQAA